MIDINSWIIYFKAILARSEKNKCIKNQYYWQTFLFLLFFRRIVKNIFEEESEFVHGIVEIYCKMDFTSIRKNKAV